MSVLFLNLGLFFLGDDTQWVVGSMFLLMLRYRRLFNFNFKQSLCAV